MHYITETAPVELIPSSNNINTLFENVGQRRHPHQRSWRLPLRLATPGKGPAHRADPRDKPPGYNIRMPSHDPSSVTETAQTNWQRR